MNFSSLGQGANQALEDGPLLARWLGPEPPGMKRRRGAKQRGLAKGGATNMGSVDLTQRVAEENYFDTLDSTAVRRRTPYMLPNKPATTAFSITSMYYV